MPETPSPSTWRIVLPREATAIPIARAMVRCALQDLEITADRSTAQLLTAELVSNALKHTSDGHPIELVVERGPDGCQVEVHDGDTVLVEGLGEPMPISVPTPMPMPVPVPVVEPGEPSSATPAAVAAATAPPASAPPATTPTPRTRGLVLVRSLSSDSGCRRTRHGKAVWFTLPEVHRPRLH